jgi:glutamate synthase (NADPH) large chain
VCHLNTCPVGVATQDPELRKRFAGEPEFVENFFRFIAEDVRELMAQLGFRTIDDMVGRVDKIDVTKAVDHWKAAGLDLSQILYKPVVAPTVAQRCVRGQDHGLEKAIDNELVRRCAAALRDGTKVEFSLPLRNVNRTVGTILGSEVTRAYGAAGLPDDTIKIHFTGSAGQSFGAFLPRGISLTLEGDANDYVGKGLSGGSIAVFPSSKATFVPEENIIVGNVTLYGATSGEAYLRGVAGERFAVRNSGAHAVVEGVGDHGCEYMTGGRVVVLGKTGRNFAAGMSGGVAYVLDRHGRFAQCCNMGMVALEPLADDDWQIVREMITRHVALTKSAYAANILDTLSRQPFVKVMPRDYKRVLLAEAKARAEDREPDFAELVGAAAG